MSSQGIIIVGAPGCGKTYYTKNTLLKGVHPDALHLFDTNQEYGDIYPHPFAPNVDKFLAKVYDMENDRFLMRNMVMVVEDATSFFSNRGRDECMQRILVGRRHPNISVVLLFHSMRDVPQYIITKCNVMVLFKTVDKDTFVKSKFDERIYDAWLGVQKRALSNRFYSTKPPPKGTKPEMAIINTY